MSHPIIQPVFALMILTFLVWCYMYFLRLRYVIGHSIEANELETPEQCNTVLPSYVNKPSNNFKNLFEAPSIFYVLCILTIISQQADTTMLYLAWSFVVGRVFHSIFHCFTKSVMARFYAYFISSIILWVMLIKFGYHLVVLT